jgi:hypothetical protein
MAFGIKYYSDWSDYADDWNDYVQYPDEIVPKFETEEQAWDHLQSYLQKYYDEQLARWEKAEAEWQAVRDLYKARVQCLKDNNLWESPPGVSGIAPIVYSTHSIEKPRSVEHTMRNNYRVVPWEDMDEFLYGPD